MGLIAYLLLGLAAGAIAKMILPEKASGGWVATLIIGVVGAMVGGWLGNIIFDTGLGHFFSIKTWVLAIGGSVIVLAIYGALTEKR